MPSAPQALAPISALKPERVQAPPRARVPTSADESQDGQILRPANSTLELPLLVTRYRVALVVEQQLVIPECQLNRPAAAAAFFGEQLQDSPREVMLAAYLDARNQLIGWQEAFAGTLTRIAAEPRLILQAALLTNAAGIVLGHNHPSGVPTPSANDLAFTKLMAHAAEAVGVQLVDHLILGTEGRWESLRERGQM